VATWAQDFAIKLVRNDQPRSIWGYVDGKVSWNCKIKVVAERQVIQPFAVSLQVSTAYFDFCDDKTVHADLNR
jgi:hypothetical protein